MKLARFTLSLFIQMRGQTVTEQRQKMWRDGPQASGKGGIWQGGEKTESNHRGCLKTGQCEIRIIDGKDMVKPNNLLLQLRTDSTNEPIAMGWPHAQDQHRAQLVLAIHLLDSGQRNGPLFHGRRSASEYSGSLVP